MVSPCGCALGPAKSEDRLRFLGMLASTILMLHPATIRAQAVRDMPTKYPENAMSGLGITTFARHVVSNHGTAMGDGR